MYQQAHTCMCIFISIWSASVQCQPAQSETSKIKTNAEIDVVVNSKQSNLLAVWNSVMFFVSSHTIALFLLFPLNASVYFFFRYEMSFIRLNTWSKFKRCYELSKYALKLNEMHVRISNLYVCMRCMVDECTTHTRLKLDFIERKAAQWFSFGEVTNDTSV